MAYISRLAEKLKENGITIGFNKNDLSLNFVGKNAFTKENLKKLKEGKKENDPFDFKKKNIYFFKPFKFIFDDDIEKIKKQLIYLFLKVKLINWNNLNWMELKIMQT